MGLFFDEIPETPAVDILADAFQSEPPASEAAFDKQALRHLTQANERFAAEVTDALTNPALSYREAKREAQRRTRAAQGPRKQNFHVWRFFVAIALFACLVGGGVAADSAHMTASSGALFGFAGSVFGVVTAFLGSEKGPSREVS